MLSEPKSLRFSLPPDSFVDFPIAHTPWEWTDGILLAHEVTAPKRRGKKKKKSLSSFQRAEARGKNLALIFGASGNKGHLCKLTPKNANKSCRYYLITVDTHNHFENQSIGQAIPSIMPKSK